MGRDDREPGNQTPKGGSFTRFFSRLERWQQLLAALVVAVAGIAAVLIPVLVTQGSGPATPSTRSTAYSAGAGTPATTNASPTATVSTQQPIYYQRPIAIGIRSGGNGLDFDIKPPGPGPGPASFFYNTFALQKGGSSTVGFGFAVWTKAGTPTASDCNTLVSTNLVGDVYAPAVGMKICFRTDQGRIGLLIVQLGTSENQFNAIASVWDS